VFTALSFVLAAVCLIPALGKLLSHPKMLAAASHFGVPWARYRLIGVAEVAAAAGALAGLASAVKDHWASPQRRVWRCCSSAPSLSTGGRGTASRRRRRR
jgi:hypothetical protein